MSNKEEHKDAKRPGTSGDNRNERFIGIDELSDYLKVKKRTLYYLASSSQIPHYKVGRLIRFKLSEIEEWMKTKKHEPENPPYGKLDGI